ncbi:sensor domain-containing diguanylate cyclase [Ferrimonas sediminicola]|uniref:diguanylate cyclase n=1 Tax=Ferrimonas sediminicola TaxID=2569538 RepID=A0A4U1B6X5_9GAMM|nr:sensor domain-containing diguanylate cyclase [Ferrimonas sediminicola]TKB46238.1 sensor domain-containing diguanylate cyclase [Ferrimonas sediminicola]
MTAQESRLLGELEDHAQKQWNHLLNMLSRVTGLPGVYLSRCDTDNMKILATSRDCPVLTRPGDRFALADLYCERVIRTGAPLAVDNGWEEPHWAGGRETQAGMISYLGLPVRQPDGCLFGTLCVYDLVPRSHIHQWRALLQSVVNIIEADLNLLDLGRSLANDSITDPLTGLMNRRGMEVRMEALLSLGSRLAAKSPEKVVLGLMLLDIDRFKQVNDTYGHITGDQLLCHFSALLTGAVRKEDLVVRWGGEEFLLLFPGIGAGDLAALAEKIRLLAMASPLPATPESLPFTVSVGYGGWNGATMAPEMLVRLDRHLLRAKQLGRNRCFGEPLLQCGR